jgi:hypothetical protein
MVSRRGVVCGIRTNKTIRKNARLWDEDLRVTQQTSFAAEGIQGSSHLTYSMHKDKQWEVLEDLPMSSPPKEKRRDRIKQNRELKKEEFQNQLVEQKQKHVKRLPVDEKSEGTEPINNDGTTEPINDETWVEQHANFKVTHQERKFVKIIDGRECTIIIPTDRQVHHHKRGEKTDRDRYDKLGYYPHHARRKNLHDEAKEVVNVYFK